MENERYVTIEGLEMISDMMIDKLSSNQNQNSREHEFDPCPSLQAL